MLSHPQAPSKSSALVPWTTLGGGCMGFAAGCLGAFLVAALGCVAGVYLGWREFAGLNDPWVEYSEVSPDGRYTAYAEGRSNFLDLEARVTIEVTGEPDTREALLPWSEQLPWGLEWTSPRALVIDLGVRGGPLPPIHRIWRDVRYRIDRE